MRTAATILLCLLTVATVAGGTRRQSTNRGRLKAVTAGYGAPAAAPDIIVADTIVPDSSDISIAGYDKPVNASKETFFVINRTSRTITSLTITLSYVDMRGRQLHQATHTVECDIPPHQTRMTAVPSWDRQRSFHYHLSGKPRKQSTPYDVSCRIDSAILR